MKRVWMIAAAVLLALVVSACSQDAEVSAAQPISAQAAAALLAQEKTVQVVDVRDKAAYEAGHIAGALLLPVREAEKAESLLPLKDTVLILYGDQEHSSADASRRLAELGYTKLHDLGDLSQWEEELETSAWEALEDKEGSLASFVSSDMYGRWVDESVVTESRLTMINIWGTFCGPCIVEMPHLAELSDEYADKGVQFVGIVLDALDSDGSYSAKVLEQARAIAYTTGADYPHLLPTEMIQQMGLANVMYVPTTIFVNAQGEQVGDPLVGSRDKQEWAKVIEEYLAMVEE